MLVGVCFFIQRFIYSQLHNNRKKNWMHFFPPFSNVLKITFWTIENVLKKWMTIFDNANMLKEGLGKNGLTKTKQKKSKFSNFLWNANEMFYS